MRLSIVSKSAVAMKMQKQVGVVKNKLENGLTVVSQDRNGAVSNLILAFRAGSRYQSVTQKGLVHHIRNFVGRDVQSYPGLQLIWSSAASGAKMNAFASRDIFGVQLSVPRENADYALSILGHVASRPAFKPWEIEDVLPTIYADLSQKSPYGIVFEDIHRAAFRNDSLAYSLYASNSEIGIYGSEEMKKFAARHFVAGNGVLVGINVDSDVLMKYSEENGGAIPEGNSVVNHMAPFRGGDFHRYARGNSVHIMIAGVGAPLNDVKQLAAQSVLLAHFGRTSPLNYSNPGYSTPEYGNPSILPHGVMGSGFGVNYDGSGLIGTYLISSEAKIKDDVKKTVEVMRNSKVQDLEECKRRAINEILFNSENSTSSGYEFATNSLFKGPDQKTLIEEIQKINQKNLDDFVKNSFEKVAISAYGNYSGIPYSDEF